MRLLYPAAALAAFALSAAAGAQDAEHGDLPPPPPPAVSGPAYGHPPAMTRADAIGRASDRFAQMDADHDGVVTKAEFQQFMAARMAARSEAGGGRHGGMGGRGAGAMGARMFDRFDANHDGKITLDEAKADAAARFDREDADHDGVISPEERRGGWSVGGEAAPPAPRGD